MNLLIFDRPGEKSYRRYYLSSVKSSDYQDPKSHRSQVLWPCIYFGHLPSFARLQQFESEQEKRTTDRPFLNRTHPQKQSFVHGLLCLLFASVVSAAEGGRIHHFLFLHFASSVPEEDPPIPIETQFPWAQFDSIEFNSDNQSPGIRITFFQDHLWSHSSLLFHHLFFPYPRTAACSIHVLRKRNRGKQREQLAFFLLFLFLRGLPHI